MEEINEKKAVRDFRLDPVEFLEKYCGLRFFEYQKILIRKMYNQELNVRTQRSRYKQLL